MYKITVHSSYYDKGIVIHSSSDKGLISGNIKQGINCVNTFEFTIPILNKYKLKERTTFLRVKNEKTNKYDFIGRIKQIEKTMDGSGTYLNKIYCQDRLAFLNDSTQSHGEYHDISTSQFLSVMLNNHNKQVEDYKKIYLGTVNIDGDSNLYRYLGYDRTLDSIMDKLVTRLDGEINLREDNGKLYLDYLKNIGKKSSTKIEIAKNLKNMSYKNESLVIPVLYPLGATIETENEVATDASQKRIDISSVNNGSQYLYNEDAIKEYGVQVITNIWNDVNEPSILLRKAKQYLEENNKVKKIITLNALDLSLIDKRYDNFELGNSHMILNPILGFNEELRIIEKNINVCSPESSTLGIGDKIKSFTLMQSESRRILKDIPRVISLTNKNYENLNKFNSNLTDVEKNISMLNEITENINLDFYDLNQKFINLYENFQLLKETVDNLNIDDLKESVESIESSLNRVLCDISVIKEHTGNSIIHITEDERQLWNSYKNTIDNYVINNDAEIANIKERLKVLEENLSGYGEI